MIWFHKRGQQRMAHRIHTYNEIIRVLSRNPDVVVAPQKYPQQITRDPAIFNQWVMKDIPIIYQVV